MKRSLFVLCVIALLLAWTGTARSEVTFEVVLQGFTENPLTADISYVRMYVNFDDSGSVEFTSAGIAGACSGWREATESGMWNGPAIFMAAFDQQGWESRHHPAHALQDGRMFWVDAATSVTGVSTIQFWNAADIGDAGANLYPGLVKLVEFSSSRAVFAVAGVEAEPSTWSKIKSLYH